VSRAPREGNGPADRLPLDVREPVTLPPVEAMERLAPDEAPATLAQLITLAVVAASRTVARDRPQNEEDDRFISLKDAAAVLLTTEDWLRRNRRRLPFVVELSEGQVRVSWKALQRFMRQKVRHGG
jgi:hypothetical protein